MDKKSLNVVNNRGYVEAQIHSARDILSNALCQWQAKEYEISEELAEIVKKLDELTRVVAF